MCVDDECLGFNIQSLAVRHRGRQQDGNPQDHRKREPEALWTGRS